MNEYFIIIGKCIFFYFVIIIALRMMGKREVGELSIFDIVIYLVMSELLALSIAEEDGTIMRSLVPICTLALLQMLVSYVLLKKKKVRDIMDGKPSIVIYNGKINQAIMYKERYNIDDMMAQIREKGCTSPDEIEYAILETSGVLSILKKTDCKVKYPNPLVNDGEINEDSLSDINKDKEWLMEELKKEGVEAYEDVFLCLYQKNGMYVIMREKKS